MNRETLDRLAKLADDFEAKAKWPIERYSDRVDALNKRANEQAASDIREAHAELTHGAHGAFMCTACGVDLHKEFHRSGCSYLLQWLGEPMSAGERMLRRD